jgi:hypothetical protein
LSLDPVAVRWFESRRGIKKSTVEAFGIYTERRDLIFPYPGGLKKRRYSVEEDNPFGLDKEGRRFTWEDENGGPAGAGQVPFLPPDFATGSHMILVEGETDTMATWENAPSTMKKHIVGLSGTGSYEKSGAADLFADARVVFVVFDNDDPYVSNDAAESTERAWRTVRKSLGAKARRVTLPQGVNDVAEFFEKYGWPAFKVLLEAASTPQMNYPRLDLKKEPKPVDWILDGLIASPDITVLWGDGGVSKSLFIQALAVAMANGDEEFLGLKLMKHGKILYIDEENPEDVVLSRLKKLGLTDKGRENLYYVWYGGVRLDTEPEKLYDDVLEFNPVALFIDSFSRIQTAPENDSDVMNKIFTDAIYPVARRLQVPVIALHHSNKTGGMRGSTAIRNAADLSLKVEPATTGSKELVDTYRMHPDKPRRGQSTSLAYKVVGLDVNGEPTDVLDDEVRVELQSTVSREEVY